MGYRSAGTRSRIVVGLLVAGAVLDLIAVFSGLSQVSLLQAIGSGIRPTPEAAQANDLRQRFIGIGQFVLFLATAVAWLVWTHRVYANLEPLGEKDRKYTPRWAVGYWFIPFVNILRPYQIMKETWNASRPVLDDQDSPSAHQLRMSASPAPVGLWWGLYLLSGVVGQVSLRLSLGAKTLAELTSATYSQIASDVVGLVSAMLAIHVARSITRMQEERHAMISTAGTSPVTRGFGASPPPAPAEPV